MFFPYEEVLKNLSLTTLAFLSGIFTLALTGVGSLGVLCLRQVNPKVFSISLGFSGGIMIAASFWSLLNPALEISKILYSLPFLPVVVGFVIGIIFLRLLDLLIPHLHLASLPSEQEGPKIPLKRGILIFLAITLHNIPEGLAIGVALSGGSENIEFFRSALNLVLGIGIQNIPEGLALALALRQAGLSMIKSFFLSFLSAIVEPLFSVAGVITIFFSHLLQPYALSLAAGAMIFVTLEELLPEAQKYGNSDLASLGFGGGFLLMMTLDTYF